MESIGSSIGARHQSLRGWARKLGIAPGGDGVSLRAAIVSARTEQRYEVLTVTGKIPGGGTDGDVLITVYGEWATLRERELDNRHDNFEPGQTDVFELKGPHIGDIRKVRIRLRGDDGWYLDRVRITKKGTSLAWQFPCGRWLSNERSRSSDCARDLTLDGLRAFPTEGVEHQCKVESNSGSATGTYKHSLQLRAFDLYVNDALDLRAYEGGWNGPALGTGEIVKVQVTDSRVAFIKPGKTLRDVEIKNNAFNDAVVVVEEWEFLEGANLALFTEGNPRTSISLRALSGQSIDRTSLGLFLFTKA